MKYRKKPVVIEAFQMTRERREDNSEWPDWLNQAWNKDAGEGAVWINPDAIVAADCDLVCGTLEGVHRIDWDDFIIQGVQGEIYPCKPDIFAELYEPVAGFEDGITWTGDKSNWNEVFKFIHAEPTDLVSHACSVDYKTVIIITSRGELIVTIGEVLYKDSDGFFSVQTKEVTA